MAHVVDAALTCFHQPLHCSNPHYHHPTESVVEVAAVEAQASEQPPVEATAGEDKRELAVVAHCPRLRSSVASETSLADLYSVAS